MRFFCGLILFLSVATGLWAQSEPCLAGTDSPDCGIKISMDPPLQAPDNSTLLVPNKITIEVPLRLHPSKVQLKTGPAGSTTADQFKVFAESARFKKAGNIVRFEMEVKDCPGPDTAFVFNIVEPKLPYPMVVKYEPLQCKQRAGQ